MREHSFQIYKFDRFQLNVAKRLLLKDGNEHIPLSSRVFDTLLYLVTNSGRVIGKDELMREIWTDSIVEENNLDKNISSLRKVLGETPGEQRFIVTVRGHGYRFAPEVTANQDPLSREGIGEVEAKAPATETESPEGATITEVIPPAN